MSTRAQRMSIGTLATTARVNVETIRFYQRKHLLAKPVRTRGEIAYYTAQDVRRVKFVKAAQRLGFTLDEVEELIRLRGTTARGRERAREVAERKLAGLEQKMAQLRDMQATLRRLIAACLTGNTPECPILAAIRSDAQSDHSGGVEKPDARTAAARRGVRKKHVPTRPQIRSAT